MKEKDLSIDWDRVREHDLSLKGYNEQDIGILNILESEESLSEIPKELLESYLKQYIHNLVIWRNRAKELKKSEAFYKNCAEKGYKIQRT